jgi:prepilin-type N-terminal cleavage/methylation domain-containing protein
LKTFTKGNQMKPSLCHQREQGLTLVELLVVLAVLTFFALMIIPAPSHPKARVMRIQCVNNLKQTGLASRVWAGDNGGKYPMEISETNGGTMEFATGPNLFRHFQLMSNELSTPLVLICPADTARLRATNFTFFNNSNVSFFLNLAASKTNSQDIWSGDNNITNGTPIKNAILELTTNHPAGWTDETHHKVGNILLSDGSVQQVSQTGLRSAVQNTSVFTNRLLMPILGP